MGTRVSLNPFCRDRRRSADFYRTVFGAVTASVHAPLDGDDVLISEDPDGLVIEAFPHPQ